MELVTGLLLVLLTAAFLWAMFEARRHREHARLLTEENDLLREELSIASEFALRMAPLLEQTDWMTGRWGGQFNQLVAMEKSRNAAVRDARRVFNELSQVQQTTIEMFDPDNELRKVLEKKARRGPAS